MNKLKAIGWFLCIPFFTALEILIAVFDREWGFKHYWLQVMCFWYGDYSTTYDGRVLDKEGTQLYPKK